MLSVVLPSDTKSASLGLEKTLASLLRQSYPRWEVWMPSRPPAFFVDERARVLEPQSSENDARWFNRVLDKAVGDFLLPLPLTAVLPPIALAEFADAIASAGATDLLYADEDTYDQADQRLAPFFKTGWDPELMLGRNIVGEMAAYRTERVRAIGGANPSLPSRGAILYDLALRVAGLRGSRPAWHIPEVLCSTSFETRQVRTLDASIGRRIVASHLERLGALNVAVVASDRAPAWNRVIWPIGAPTPLTSLIIPTRNQGVLLSRCMDGVLTRTDYPAIEVLIVDNGSVDPEAIRVMQAVALDSRVRVLHHDAPFNFSELNNLAAREATGEVLVLLNDDIEVMDAEWLRELVSQALRPEVGIVGARLLYPTGAVQHAGIVMESGGPHHQYRLCDGTELGPIGELALARSVTGVTAACVALRRSVFDEVGGLDEEFAVAFGDVDLCLRVAERGYRIICTPFAELYHHESASRGYEDNPIKQARFAEEVALLRRRWEMELWTERYANPNLLFGWSDTGSWGLPRPSTYRGRRGTTPRAVDSRLARTVQGAGRVLRAMATPVVPNPLFSSEWYLASYPEVAGYRFGPYQHYRKHGVKDGRNPNRLFDTRWYLAHYPDVAAKGMNPLDHYLRHGASEGRDPSPGFSTRRYLDKNPDVLASGMNPLEHSLRCGGRGSHPGRGASARR